MHTPGLAAHKPAKTAVVAIVSAEYVRSCADVCLKGRVTGAVGQAGRHVTWDEAIVLTALLATTGAIVEEIVRGGHELRHRQTERVGVANVARANVICTTVRIWPALLTRK